MNDERLIEVLERSRALGFLGPGPVISHVHHARRLVALLGRGASVIDLGSGGGVPGLVVSADREDLAVTMVDVRQGRVDFLIRAIGSLGLGSRCRVICSSAEVLARRHVHQHRYDLVVARSFGPLPRTLACGVPFLAPGGRIIVSASRVEALVDLGALGLVAAPTADPGFRMFETSLTDRD